MNLTFDVKSAHLIHEPTIIENDAGTQVAQAGAIVLTLADGTEFAFKPQTFTNLWPEIDIHAEAHSFGEESARMEAAGIPQDATPLMIDDSMIPEYVHEDAPVGDIPAADEPVAEPLPTVTDGVTEDAAVDDSAPATDDDTVSVDDLADTAAAEDETPKPDFAPETEDALHEDPAGPVPDEMLLDAGDSNPDRFNEPVASDPEDHPVDEQGPRFDEPLPDTATVAQPEPEEFSDPGDEDPLN